MSNFSDNLLTWYAAHARELPWRATREPYAVLVSEFMLQQTRVVTVIPYFQRWMRKFPTIKVLAAAPLDEVLKTWEGLGYYARARNLHKTAQIVMAEYGGVIPSHLEGLRRLPGVGEYTAAAVGSIAFGADTPALDGNLRRVLARVSALRVDPRSPEGAASLRDMAASLLPPGRAGDFNQALMDLSSAVCTPKKPGCPACPLANLCQANQLGLQTEIPVKLKKPPVPIMTVTAGVLRRGSRILLTKRPANGLLGGLWEFPGGKQEPGETLPECLARELDEELGIKVNVGAPIGTFKHAYTHFKVILHAFECEIIAGEPKPLSSDGLVWVETSNLNSCAMGKIDRMIALQLNVDQR